MLTGCWTRKRIKRLPGSRRTIRGVAFKRTESAGVILCSSSGGRGCGSGTNHGRGCFRRRQPNRNSSMPYTRPIRRFYLTPPAVPTFVISVLLAVQAVLAVYGHIPQLHSIGGFTLLLIAYAVLLLGTLLRGI